MIRNADVSRKTSETDVIISLEVDGTGESIIGTSNGFLDHMLNLFAKHGLFNLNVKCLGDVEIDFHHSAEDIGITLGMAFKEALGDKRGINRYSHSYIPMDETLIRVVLDICGRTNLVYTEDLRDRKVNNFEVDLVYDFMKGFCDYAGVSMHIDILRARNSHHAIEAIFKGFGRALRTACEIDPRSADQIPSTKGVI
jgi:imidazoleglycerol-phosphate dehydratase